MIASPFSFLGCAAYPEGIAALLVSPSSALSQPSTFTPFDTGALDRFLLPTDTNFAWDEPAKQATLESFLGRGEDARAFAGPYIAAHLCDPIAYLERPQTSKPDWPPYHGLASTSGDRRAWTIEVQVHGDVELPPDSSRLDGIVLGNHDLASDVPDDYLRFVTIAAAEDEVASTVAEEIARRARAGVV